MARLSKHGSELLRVQKETDVTNPEDCVTWRCDTRAYMSDGTVLRKLDVRFKPDQLRPKGYFYSYGWKIKGKLKPGLTMPEHIKHVLANLSGPAKAGGWVVLSGGPAPVIISEKRIIAAIESGDSIGFCRACGEETDGVEPDARGYRCESCGQHEVYGAEEMLLTL